MGRPKKVGAIKAGELRSDLCRFSFIAHSATVDAIKAIALAESITIKDLMHNIILTNPAVKKEMSKKKVATKGYINVPTTENERKILKSIKANRS